MKSSDTFYGHSFHFLGTHEAFQHLSLFSQDGSYVVVVLVAVGTQNNVCSCFGLWDTDSLERISHDGNAFSLKFETRMTVPYYFNQTTLISFSMF
jgi:hypothetical protein